MSYTQNPKSEFSKTVSPNSIPPDSETLIAEIPNSKFLNTETPICTKYCIGYFGKCQNPNSRFQPMNKFIEKYLGSSKLEEGLNCFFFHLG